MAAITPPTSTSPHAWEIVFLDNDETPLEPHKLEQNIQILDNYADTAIREESKIPLDSPPASLFRSPTPAPPTSPALTSAETANMEVQMQSIIPKIKNLQFWSLSSPSQTTSIEIPNIETQTQSALPQSESLLSLTDFWLLSSLPQDTPLEVNRPLSILIPDHVPVDAPISVNKADISSPAKTVPCDFLEDGTTEIPSFPQENTEDGSYNQFFQNLSDETGNLLHQTQQWLRENLPSEIESFLNVNDPYLSTSTEENRETPSSLTVSRDSTTPENPTLSPPRPRLYPGEPINLLQPSNAMSRDLAPSPQKLPLEEEDELFCFGGCLSHPKQEGFNVPRQKLAKI